MKILQKKYERMEDLWSYLLPLMINLNQNVWFMSLKLAAIELIEKQDLYIFIFESMTWDLMKF